MVKEIDVESLADFYAISTHRRMHVPVHTSRSHRSLVIRVRRGEDGRCTSCCRSVTTVLVHVTERRAMCSRVARVPSCGDTRVL
jgi:hypothetical protein